MSAAAGTLLVLAVSIGICLRAPIGLDYGHDAGPAIDALLRGDFERFFEAQPLMGTLSVLVRAPFAALADLLGDGDDLARARLGAIPCVAAVGFLALYLWQLARRRGQLLSTATAAAGLVIVNPLTFNALQTGHPEELLTAALCVGAVVAALDGRYRVAMLLLGLALATKQWAVIALIPTLLALPRPARARFGLAACAVAAVLMAPFVFGDPSTFLSRNVISAANTHTDAYAFTVWRPFAEDSQTLPPWFGFVSHPLIVLLPLPLSFLYWRRHPDPSCDLLLLLGLLFLLRCVLDPVNNGYYHVPFLISLAAYEGLQRPGLPVLTISSSAALWVLIHFVWTTGDYALTNGLYLAWALTLIGYMAVRLYATGSLLATKRGRPA